MTARSEEVSGLMSAPPPSLDEGLGGVPAAGSLGRIGAEDETTWRNFICRSQHPVAAFFHLVFKAAAVTLYIFGSLLGYDYVTTFVLCILLLAADFWAVKNVTARLLVGLRWWVNIKDDGTNEWLYESAPARTGTIPALDSRIFWWTLYLTPAIWVAFAALSFIKLNLDWLLVDLTGIALTGANLVGYYRCSADAQRRLRSSLASGAMAGLSLLPGALPAMGAGMLSMLGATALRAVAGAATGAAAPAAATGAAAPAAATVSSAPAADTGAASNPWGAAAAGGTGAAVPAAASAWRGSADGTTATSSGAAAPHLARPGGPDAGEAANPFGDDVRV